MTEARHAPPTVILITDPRYTLARTIQVIETIGGALGSGRLAVQLRDKSAATPTLAAAARALRSATERAGALFVLNAPSSEALHVAFDVGADGVHVPCRHEAITEARARFGRRAWLSAPAHTDDDVVLAADAGATAVLVSPIFETPGKGQPRGADALAAARRLCAEALAIYALGGVSRGTAAACATSGADGVAVIRALLEAADPAAVARDLDAPFQTVRRR